MNEPLAIATLLVIAVTGYVSYRAFNNQRMLDAFMFSPTHILRDKEYRRLLTSGLIHANWPHLLFNMFSLYVFGRAVEIFFGPHILLLIYLSSILGGSLLSLYCHRHHEYRALGASGGVCGVIFASIFLLPGGEIIIFPLPFGIQSWLYAILFILASFFGMRRQRDNIGHDAHLGGALCGLGVATIMYPEIIGQSPRLYMAVVIITAGLLIYSYKYPLALQASGPFTRRYWQNKRSETKYRRESQQMQRDDETMEMLLEKISREGMDSLTASEKKQLATISERKNEQENN